jgi:hypothetical protein
MRHVFIAILTCLCTFSDAQARECQLPSPSLSASDEVFGSYNALSCALDEIADLKAEQRRMRSQIDKLQQQIGELPGEFQNDNGKISQPNGSAIGSAIFRLDARQGVSSSSLPLDQSVLEALCGKKGGCLISIFLEAEGLRLTDTSDTIAVGPCAISYNATTGAWARGTGCGETGAERGVDGNGAPGAGGGDEIVTAAGGACVLSDADAARSVGGSEVFGPDASRGFFLVAAPTLREKSGGRFRCELKIE